MIRGPSARLSRLCREWNMKTNLSRLFLPSVTSNLIVSCFLLLGQVSSSEADEIASRKTVPRGATTAPSTRPVQGLATQPENSNSVSTPLRDTIEPDEVDGGLIGSPFWKALMTCDEKKV